MTEGTTEPYEARRQRLARLMSQCDKVTRYDTPNEEEAWTLAHSLLDLEGSFQKFTRELLPKLEHGKSDPDDIYDILLSIGEEFRHILYHIGDPKFFEYLPAWGGGRREGE